MSSAIDFFKTLKNDTVTVVQDWRAGKTIQDGKIALRISSCPRHSRFVPYRNISPRRQHYGCAQSPD